MTKPFIICDIDGTIANFQHRKHHIQKCHESAGIDNTERHVISGPDWNAFNAACVDDPPVEDIIHILRTFQDQATILLITGRSDLYQAYTLAWLHKHRVPWDILRMRKQGDYRSDVDVKREIYAIINMQYLARHSSNMHTLFVLEDRDKVVAMWRELGLTCLQVAKGEY